MFSNEKQKGKDGRGGGEKLGAIEGKETIVNRKGKVIKIQFNLEKRLRVCKTYFFWSLFYKLTLGIDHTA